MEDGNMTSSSSMVGTAGKESTMSNERKETLLDTDGTPKGTKRTRKNEDESSSAGILKRRKRDECDNDDTDETGMGAVGASNKKRRSRGRSVSFGESVKTNDGLRPTTRIFEEILLAFLIEDKIVTPKNLLIYLEKKGELGYLTSISSMCDDAVRRLKTRASATEEKRRRINPMLPNGGGKGFGLMPHDMDRLLEVQALLASSVEIYRAFQFSRDAQKGKEDAAVVVSPSPNSVCGLPRPSTPEGLVL